MRKYLLILIISILVIIGLIGVSSVNRGLEPEAKVEAEQKTNFVSLETGTNTFSLNFMEGETAEDFLIRLRDSSSGFTFEMTKFDFGVFVIAINGVSASNDEFWEFRVNGKQSDKGISDYYIKPGDKFEFKLTKI